MSPPEADPAEPVPEEVMRQVAREEARAVYDEHTVTGPDGQEWSFNTLVERIGELEGGIGRRTYIKAAMALGYIAMGTAGGTAIMQVMSQPARADAFGESGTQADPLTKLWAHELGAGDGADVQTLGDAIQHANEAVSSATTIGNVCYIEVDTSVAGFPVTIPATLEKSGLELRFIDAGGSAGTNSYDIDSTNWNIDGSATLTVDASDTATVLYSAGDRWITSRFIETVDARSVVTDKLVIGGTLYEEDDNSPINVSSTSSTTYTLANSADGVIVIPELNNHTGFDELQVNGDTGSNYSHIDTADSKTTGQTEWGISFFPFRSSYLEISGTDGSRIGFYQRLTRSGTTLVYRGENGNVSPPITKFTFSDSGGSNRSLSARVYRRVMNV